MAAARRNIRPNPLGSRQNPLLNPARHSTQHGPLLREVSLSTSIYPFISELLLSLCWPFCFTLRSFFLLVSILLLCLLSFFLSLYLVLSNLWLSLSVFAFCVRNFFLSFSLQSLTLSLSLSLSLSVFAFCVRNFFQSFSLTLFLPLFHTFLFLSLSCITFSLSLYYSPIIDPVSLSFFCLLLCFVFLFTQSFSAFMLQDDFYFLKGYPS